MTELFRHRLIGCPQSTAAIGSNIGYRHFLSDLENESESGESTLTEQRIPSGEGGAATSRLLAQGGAGALDTPASFFQVFLARRIGNTEIRRQAERGARHDNDFLRL